MEDPGQYDANDQVDALLKALQKIKQLQAQNKALEEQLSDCMLASEALRRQYDDLKDNLMDEREINDLFWKLNVELSDVSPTMFINKFAKALVGRVRK